MKVRAGPVLVSCIWLASAYAWISNAVYEAQAQPPNYAPLWVLALFAVLVVILYLAEGMEIAIADLRDKDISQLQDESTRKVLQQIQGRQDFFFSQRQLFVVSIISFISIAISGVTPRFHIYGLPPVEDAALAGIINFIFINILILCVCQVVPKRLALVNSEQFLSQSKWIWQLIKIVGWINIPGPSDLLVPVFRNLAGFKNRQLPPGRSSHYNASALINGHCIDQRSISLALRRDGGGDIQLHYLVLFLHGRRKTITGSSKVGAPAARYINNVEILGTWTLPSVEDLKEHAACLDSIFAGCIDGKSVKDLCDQHGVPSLDLGKRVTKTITPPAGAADLPDWTIEFLDELPENLNPGTEPHKNILCVLYRASGAAPANSFYVGRQDNWSERMASACRKLIFSVTGGADVQISIPDCEVTLEKPANKLAVESQRASLELKEAGVIAYPIQSAVYDFHWSSLV